jgi:hypothetical protein
MDIILSDFKDFARAYIDDIVIASKTLPDHLHYIKLVLSRFVEYNIAIKGSKCFFGYPSATVLDYKVDSLGISIIQKRLVAIE